MLYIETKKLLVEVRQNPDGSLLLTADGVNSIPNAGAVIGNLGGIQGTLDRAIETDKTLPQLIEERQQRKQQAVEAQVRATQKQIERIEQEYNNLLASSPNGIETNIHNLYIVAAYLATVNWGAWELPRMTIGYSAYQYDCYGHIAVTFQLDEPIEYRGAQTTKLVFNAPLTHLTSYKHFGMLGFKIPKQLQ